MRVDKKVVKERSSGQKYQEGGLTCLGRPRRKAKTDLLLREYVDFFRDPIIQFGTYGIT